MLLNGKKIIVAGIVLLLGVLSGAAGYYLGGKFTGSPPPAYKPAVAFRPVADFYNPKVSSDAVLIRNREYLCGDIEKLSEGKAPGELVGMDRDALFDKFPVTQGWIVNLNSPELLILTEKTDDLCPLHCQYRHLGLYQGSLAVYEGPLDYNGKVLRVENIPLESLDPDFMNKLEQATKFERLSYHVPDELREELEFDSDETLNAALENLDEQS